MTAVVDQRGRLFGRINLVDAAIGAFVVVLIPLAYATVLLFRPSKPTITSVDHAQMTNVEERAGGGTRIDGKLKIHGTGLRPTLRATIGQQDAVGFLFETPSSADVLFGAIVPGTHDLVLYDGVQEVARAKDAVTIAPPPVPVSARVLAVGAFIGLDEPTAERLTASAPPSSTDAGPSIIALGPSIPDYRRVGFSGGLIDLPVEGRFQRPAAVLVACEVNGGQECRVDGASLGLLERTLIVPVTTGLVKLLIQELVPSTPPLPTTVRVRFAGHPEVLDRVAVRDRDMSWLSLDGRGAEIQALVRRPDVVGQLTVGASDADHNGERTTATGQTSIPERLAVADAVLRLGADQSPLGWRYRGQPLRAGGAITFTTDSYTVRGSILGVVPAQETGAHRTSTP
jgi:hypothetical protein